MVSWESCNRFKFWVQIFSMVKTNWFSDITILGVYLTLQAIFCRYRLAYSSNYSKILDPLVENNYQLFMIERLILMGAKTYIRTFKEDETYLSLTDDPKKNTKAWQIPVYTSDGEGSWHCILSGPSAVFSIIQFILWFLNSLGFLWPSSCNRESKHCMANWNIVASDEESDPGKWEAGCVVNVVNCSQTLVESFTAFFLYWKFWNIYLYPHDILACNDKFWLENVFVFIFYFIIWSEQCFALMMALQFTAV